MKHRKTITDANPKPLPEIRCTICDEIFTPEKIGDPICPECFDQEHYCNQIAIEIEWRHNIYP